MSELSIKCQFQGAGQSSLCQVSQRERLNVTCWCNPHSRKCWCTATAASQRLQILLAAAASTHTLTLFHCFFGGPTTTQQPFSLTPTTRHNTRKNQISRIPRNISAKIYRAHLSRDDDENQLKRDESAQSGQRPHTIPACPSNSLLSFISTHNKPAAATSSHACGLAHLPNTTSNSRTTS